MQRHIPHRRIQSRPDPFCGPTPEQWNFNRHREAALAAAAIQKNPQTLPWIASGFAALAVAMTSDPEFKRGALA
jgi:hypothetical protein